MNGAGLHLFATEGLVVDSEIPNNSFTLLLKNSANFEIQLYLNRDQWWLLRQLPKSSSYSFWNDIKQKHELDHSKADELALEFYNNCAPKTSVEVQA